jgi:hypothetical protein
VAAPLRWLDPILKHPLTARAVTALGVQLGQEASRLRAGEIDEEEFARRVRGHLGALFGTLLGAGAGWMVGRRLPGLGKVVSSFCGGVVGELAGEHLAREGLSRARRRARAQTSEAEGSVRERRRREL